MALELELASELPKSVDKTLLVAVTNALSERIAGMAGKLNLKFLGEKQMIELNQRYASNPEATDVLTFDYREGGESSEEIGDIAICLPIARAQAKSANIPLEHEIAWLLLHGALHLAGYDHVNKSEQAKMELSQLDIAKKVGLLARTFEWK